MSQEERLEPFAYGCRGCGRVARTTRELTAAGCEGKHEPLISRADHEAEVGELKRALQQLRDAVVMPTETLYQREKRQEWIDDAMSRAETALAESQQSEEG